MLAAALVQTQALLLVEVREQMSVLPMAQALVMVLVWVLVQAMAEVLAQVLVAQLVLVSVQVLGVLKAHGSALVWASPLEHA